MKKLFFLSMIVATSLVLVYCNPSKKVAAVPAEEVKPVPKSTYESGVATLVASHCAPCHIAGKGNKKPYDNYANLKTDIDEIIRRIELSPTERGFMPFRKATKLSDSTIAVFKQWKTDGLLEK
jgi:cytochrome c553